MRGKIRTMGSAGITPTGVIKLYRPKMNPVKAPTTGPSKIAARITGTCIIVARPASVGMGIIPKPVTLRTIATAPSIPATAIFLVEILCPVVLRVALFSVCTSCIHLTSFDFLR